MECNQTPENLSALPDEALDYLCFEPFLRDAVQARALGSAFELHVIDYLASADSAALETLQRDLALDPWGLRLLCDLLRANAVISGPDNALALTAAFRKALRYADLLRAKLDFAHLAARDVAAHFTLLLQRPGELLRRADMFKLFDYSRSCEPGAENLEFTKRWMRFTTLLTRYEAPACLAAHDFSPYRRMLDIGGNSGEFCLQACRRHPELRASVFDLPAVCEAGREHVRREPEAQRIQFIAGNALVDTLPAGADLITFKSMLHDWPDEAADRFLAKAADAVASGGTVLIFERAQLPRGVSEIPYSLLPMLLFARGLRGPEYYAQRLGQLGLTEVGAAIVPLEMPFLLVSGRKAPPSGC